MCEALDEVSLLTKCVTFQTAQQRPSQTITTLHGVKYKCSLLRGTLLQTKRDLERAQEKLPDSERVMNPCHVNRLRNRFTNNSGHLNN